MKTEEEAKKVINAMETFGITQFGEKNHLWLRHIKISAKIIHMPSKPDDSEDEYVVEFSFKGAYENHMLYGFQVGKVEPNVLNNKEYMLENIQRIFLEESSLKKIKLDYDFYVASQC